MEIENLPEQKQQQESISAGVGSNPQRNKVGPQLSRISLENVSLNSADGQNITQNNIHF